MPVQWGKIDVKIESCIDAVGDCKKQNHKMGYEIFLHDVPLSLVKNILEEIWEEISICDRRVSKKNNARYGRYERE